MNHELQRSGHTGPPAERLYVFYRGIDCLVLPTPGSLKLYRYLYHIAWYRAGEDERVVVGADDVELAMAYACAEGRIAMLEGDELTIEVCISIHFPSRDRVFLEELEAVVPSHLLTGIDEGLSARQREGEHSHGLGSIAHTLKLGACPRVLIVVGGEHQTISTFGVACDILINIGNEVIDILFTSCDGIHHVVQFPRIRGVEATLALQQGLFAFGQHEDIGVLGLDALDGLLPEGEGYLTCHVAAETVDTALEPEVQCLLHGFAHTLILVVEVGGIAPVGGVGEFALLVSLIP